MIFNKFFEWDQGKIKSFVDTRFTEMQIHRKQYDKNWSNFSKQYNAEFEWYSDPYRASSKIPLAKTLVELYISYAVKMKPEFNFNCDENKSLARMYSYIWKNDEKINKRNKVIIQDEYNCAIYGTSVMYTGIENKIRKQYELKKWAIWLSNSDYKEVKKEEIAIKTMNVELRDFYLDDRATLGIEDAEDCIRIVEMSLETFKTLTDNEYYSNTDKVKWESKTNQDKVYNIKEDFSQSSDNVYIKCYWNIIEDMYVEIANDVVVRATPIMETINGKKALPFVFRQFNKKVGGYYGAWYCEACLMFQSEINTLRELLIDQMRRSWSDVILMGEWLTFDWEDYSYGNYIKNVSWSINDNNFRIMQNKGIDQSLVNLWQTILNQIWSFVGIDINTQIDPQGTAFQTQVMQESSQKRVNVVITNRDFAYERYADLHMENLIRYYDLEKDPKKKLIYTQDEIRDKWQKRFLRGVENKGKNAMKIESNMLDWPVRVEVYTNLTAPTIASVDRQQTQDFLTNLWAIVNSFAIAKQSWYDIETIMPLDETIKELAVKYNIKSEEAKEEQKDIDQEVDKLRQELMKIWGMQDIMNTEQVQEEQVQEEQSRL